MNRTGIDRLPPKRWLPLAAAMAFFCLLASSLVAPAPAQAAGMTLRETGSTLLYPLFQLWIRDYPGVTPGVTLTAAATGSGVGEQQVMLGEAQIGASDAYMSDEQAEQNPGVKNIPVAISAQTVNYNIPGLNKAGLKLDGPTLAGIYTGRITDWDAAPIKAMNPGVDLPHRPIVPIRRADGSGDTFIFTQFLAFSTQSWADAIGYGLKIDWPAVAAALNATGNEGMVKTAAKTPYSLAYIGISFRDATAQAGLGTALLRNQNGGITVKTWDENQIEIKAKASSDAIEVMVIPSEQRLTVQTHPKGDMVLLLDARVDFEIRVPRESMVRVDSERGQVSIENVKGDIAIDGVSNSVVLSLRSAGGLAPFVTGAAIVSVRSARGFAVTPSFFM